MAGTHAFGGRHRIGVVLSVLWLVAVSAYASYDYFGASPGDNTVFVVWFDTERRVYADDQWRKQRIAICNETCGSKKTDLNCLICQYETANLEANLEKRLYWPGYASIAAGSIILFWLVVYLSAWVIRWIGRGFQSKGT